ncbi:DNA-formamidopyrimidine glycosylase [Priestia koreensis]|uniref:DNA-formamidopyrimidine glycosylase n=1 Tax=Priestia koreensis TaxID=284581 RepID=UPI001F59E925|nr:DNA-formamidopyrimidine glycosylase [Priestia koreensis]UNL84465.1 DNA-formamidopyrimidine glycosylase [Priestia koreensis]
MPELPEVETVRRTLIELVKGKTIKTVTVLWPNIIKKPAEIEQFADALIGETIQDVGRRGKFLKIFLDHYVIVSHLRMEGRYALAKKEEPYDKHTHVMFEFTDGTELRYRDVRKFGTMHLFTKGQEETEAPLATLGPEPFDEAFTPTLLKERLKKTNRKVKAALLDQTIVVGLGNIYVDEALFRASIHPEKISNQLTDDEITKLHEEIIKTLGEAIESGGSTIRSYVNTQGKVGQFQLQLYVYGKKGEACRNCGTAIEKTVVAGRGTHICPKCQQLS